MRDALLPHLPSPPPVSYHKLAVWRRPAVPVSLSTGPITHPPHPSAQHTHPGSPHPGQERNGTAWTLVGSGPMAPPPQQVIEVREVTGAAPSNTGAKKVDARWNSAGASWHLVSGDGVLFCVSDEFVRGSSTWRNIPSPCELNTPEPAVAVRLLLSLSSGERLDALPTHEWPLADDLLKASLLAARHALPVSRLCAAYLQLLAWRAGRWAELFEYGARVGDKGLCSLAAVKIVESGRRFGMSGGGRSGEGEGGGGGAGGSAEGATGGVGGQIGARLQWAMERLAQCHDPFAGWKGTREMRPEDRFWQYVVEAEK